MAALGSCPDEFSYVDPGKPAALGSCPDELPPVDPGKPLDQPYTLADAQVLYIGERVTRRAAHKTLNDLRLQHSLLARATREAVDLTDGKDFKWRGYLAGHPDRTTIFDGHGIVLFEFLFLRTMEGNHNARPDLPPFRADFVAHRTDGQVLESMSSLLLQGPHTSTVPCPSVDVHIAGLLHLQIAIDP